MANADYTLIGTSGYYHKVSDDTGPYVQTAPGVFVLAATGSGGGGGGGGGGAVTVADGADVAAGSTTDAAAAAGGTGTISAKLRRISTQLPASLGVKTAAASLPVTIASDDAQFGAKTTASVLSAGGSGVLGWLSDAVAQLKALVVGVTINPTCVSTASVITRPANVTAYGANSVVGGALTFASAGASGGNITIQGVSLRYNVAAIPSGMANMRLYLYNATPPSALTNTATWDLPAGDRAAFLGYIDIGSLADLGSTLYAQVDQVNKACKLAGGSTALYGYLVTSGAFTPAGVSEVLQVTLVGLANI